MKKTFLLIAIAVLLLALVLIPSSVKDHHDFMHLVIDPATGIVIEELQQGKKIDDVPALDWSYGCSPTAAGMLFGYYDRHGFDNTYIGPTNEGIFPLTNTVWGNGECPLVASHSGIDSRSTDGHVDDYWVAFRNKGNDPCSTGCHPDDSLADFMGTSQDRYNNSDGATTFYSHYDGKPLVDYTGSEPSRRDGCHGMRLFAESRGYVVTTNYTQKIVGVTNVDPLLGFTYEQYVNEIDNGYPVILQLEGHTILGIGYTGIDKGIYVLDTWDHSMHTMVWGNSYSGMLHYAVTVIHVTSPGIVPVTITIRW